MANSDEVRSSNEVQAERVVNLKLVATEFMDGLKSATSAFEPQSDHILEHIERTTLLEHIERTTRQAVFGMLYGNDGSVIGRITSMSSNLRSEAEAANTVVDLQQDEDGVWG